MMLFVVLPTEVSYFQGLIIIVVVMLNFWVPTDFTRFVLQDSTTMVGVCIATGIHLLPCKPLETMGFSPFP